MKRKMKRIWKGILTLVLVATMLFGQFPSGLVLVANAEPAGEIGPAIQEITETPPISAGAGSVVDKTTYVTPESASEIVSSEGNSEELTDLDKELDSAPVSEKDSSLTDYENSEITSEDDSQIPEKGNSEVADSEEEIDNAADSEEKVSEMADSETAESEEAKSEGETDSSDETAFSAIGKTAIALSVILSDYISGNTPKNAPTEPEQESQKLGGEETKEVEEPGISLKDGVDATTLQRVYSSTDSSTEISKALFDIVGNNLPDGKTVDEIFEITVYFDWIGEGAPGANKDGYDIKADVNCKDDYVFAGGSKNKTIPTGYKYKILPKNISLSQITIVGSKTYDGSCNLPSDATITYTFDDSEATGGGITFKLDSPDATETATIVVDDASNFTTDPNYSCTLPETRDINQLINADNFNVNKKEVKVVFENNISKMSDGLTDLPDLTNAKYRLLENSTEITGVTVSVNSEATDKWKYNLGEGNLLFGNDIPIGGVNTATDFEIKKGDVDLTGNYSITSELKGNITPYIKENVYDVRIELDKNPSNNYDLSNYFGDGVSINFDENTRKDKEDYWFGAEKNGTKLTAQDVTFYSFNSQENSITENELMFPNGSAYYDGESFQNLVFKFNGVDKYYGPINVIAFKYDKDAPTYKSTYTPRGKKQKEYIAKDAFEDSHSGIERKGFWKTGSGVTITLEDIVDDQYDGDLPSETLTVNASDLNNVAIWAYARDYVGNRTLKKLSGDAADGEAPVISIAEKSEGQQSVSEVIKETFNGKNYLSSVGFGLNVQDNQNVKSVDVYLLDGVSGNVYCDDNDNSNYHKTFTGYGKNWSNLISFDSDSFGYQLSFLIKAEDNNSNISYAKAYWKSEGVIDITTLDVDDSYTPSSTVIGIDETFAIVGEGNNTPGISVDFNDENKYVREVEGVYYFQADERKAKVNFNKMAIDSVEFKNDAEQIGGNNNEFSLTYDSSQHCYVYKGEDNKVNWTFSARPEKYSVSLESDKPEFVGMDPVAKSETEEGVNPCNTSFVVNNTKPEVTIQMDMPTNTRGTKDYYSYEGEDYVKAKVTVSGDNLPKLENINDYVEVYYENNPLNKVPVYSSQWSGNQTDGYSATLVFKEDGASSLQVYAGNLASPGKESHVENWGKSEKKEFILDCTAPIFDITYSGHTNNVNSEYYYGLQDGLTEDQATDIKASVSITEANLFKDDVTIKVWKDGVLYEGEYKTEFDPNAEGVEKWPNANDKTNKGTFILTIPGKDNDGEFDIHVSYTDPALHKMVSGSEDYTVVDGTYDGSERTDIIDTIRPVATYSISEYSDGHYDNDGDYYNYAFETKFAVDDKNYANKVGDESYITATYNYQPVKGSAETDISLDCNEADKTYTYQVGDSTGDGSFYFYINGKDLAGNVLKVKKGAGTTSNDHFDEEGVENGIIVLDGADSKYESGKKVLDRTNPTVELELNTGSAKKYIPEGYSRYFFNKDFSGAFTVSDVNPDGKKVNFGIGTNNASKNYVTDSVGAINRVGDDYPFEETEQTVKYSFNSDKEGLYAYSISGCDKAGNKIVLAADATDESKAWHKYIEDETGITTYVIVLDKTAPTTNISMDNFYKAELVNDDGTDKYNVSKNKPYQKKTSAVVLFEEDDKSPASISYKIVSTLEECSVNRAVSDEKDYVKNFTESVLMDGAQTFNIEKLSVIDMAGNEVKMPDPSNYIYLDTAAPTHDNLRPAISFEPKGTSSGSGRGPAGNPLFTGDVNVEVTITDPGEKKNSSGLYQVYYEIQVKENDNYKSYTGSCIPSSSVGSAGNGLITYGTDGPDYSNPVSTKNQNLKYSDKLTFAFNAGTFNNNDVKVYVWAKDNAGNEITREQAASYSFGIDTKAPAISVGYDNNDAQNGKYFKANRTATITVTERNFDGSRTSISTQAGAHVSGWSYQRGSSPNGDDDRWVATVVYDTDGDYTLGVSATDIVGHGAGGVDWGNSVAPADFTLDKTMPVINVFFDNNNVQNGRYYNANRRATIDITEHNFDTKDVVVERTASIAEGNVAVPGVGAWTRQADLNRSEVFFGQDGDYTMKVDYVDLAGNPAQTFSIDLFTIDTVAPTLEITGVEDKHAYNGNVAPVITYHDINCDKNSAEVRISGYKHPSGSNLNGVRSDAAFGGSFACDNIERVRENDDVYTAIGSVRDLAGNETSKDVMFSVNRFGSTYILGKETEELVDKYYTNQEETLIVKEINVNELTKTEVSFSKGGEPKDLEKGTGYTVQSVKVDNDGWWEYNYEIGASSFAEDGAYIVNLKSEDAATNANSNNSIKQNDGQNELPIEFFIDKAAPSLTISGVEDGARYRETQRIIGVRFDDNSYVADLKFYVNDQLINQYDAKTLAELDDSLIEYTALSKNNWQNVKVEATDAAGNTNEVKIDRFLITRNFFIQFVNNIPLLIGSIVGVSLLVIGLFLLIFFLRRRKERY